MSKPEDPDNKQPPQKLNDKIDELEELINAKPDLETAKKTPLNIPVLDEIVDYNAESVLRNVLSKQAMERNQPVDSEHISQEQLTNVLDQVESKIADELDSLVDVLKNTIKDNLMSEIKSQLSTSEDIEDTGSAISDKNDPDP